MRRQQLDGGVSTYVGHLKLVNEALRVATASAALGVTPLVLLDELGAGTDPAQGAALGRATLEALVDDGAIVVATTHHAPLKALAAEDARPSGVVSQLKIQNLRHVKVSLSRERDV